MTPFRTQIALLLLTAAVLLVVGCTMNQTGNTNHPNITLAPVQVLARTPPIPEKPACPPYVYNGTYWIAIDPIGQVRGTPFLINGTTNLPAILPSNRTLLLIISPVQLEPRDKEQAVLFYGVPYHTFVDINEGGGCANSFSANVTQLESKSGEYTAEIGLNEGPENSLDPRNQTQFYYIRW
jgi:hypothetical protein